MKKYLSLLLILVPFVASAVNVTIPQSTGAGVIPVGNANGTYTPNGGNVDLGANTITANGLQINGNDGAYAQIDSDLNVGGGLYADGGLFWLKGTVNYAIFDASPVDSSDKTFTLPNISGTFLLATGTQNFILGSGTTSRLVMNGNPSSEIIDGSSGGYLYLRGKPGTGQVGIEAGEGLLASKIGGLITVYGGTGYTDPGSGTGGVGGNVTFGGGIGGDTDSGTGGDGGILQLNGGKGGDSSSGTGGNGGHLDIQGGRGGSGGSGDGISGVIDLGVLGTSAVNIGATTITTTIAGKTVMTNASTTELSVANGLDIGTQWGVLYGNQGPVSAVNNNPTSELRFLSQVGSTTPTWQTIPQAGNFTYFLYQASSSVSTYKGMDTTHPSSTMYSLSATYSAASTTAMQWLTPAGSPGIVTIPAGFWNNHLDATVDAVTGTKQANVYFDVFKYSVGGVETRLFSTQLSQRITTTDILSPQEIDIESDELAITLLSTDRLIVKAYVVVSGTGGNPVVTLYWEGQTQTRLELPSNTIDASNFVPYSGALHNLNMGAFGVSTTNATATNAYVSNRLGIGTTSPSNALEVNGSGWFNSNLTATNITATGTLTVKKTASIGPVINLSNINLQVSSTSDTQVDEASIAVSVLGGQVDDTASYYFGANGSRYLGRISSIVKGSFASDMMFSIASTSATSPSHLTERMRITSGGNVGIGTTTPGGFATTYGKLLHVWGDNEWTGIGVENTVSNKGAFFNQKNNARKELLFGIYGSGLAGTKFGVNYANNAFIYTYPDSALSIGTHGAANLTLGTNSTANVTIQNGGNVGIGTTSPSNKLEVNGSGYFTGNLWGANITATGTLTVLGTGSSTVAGDFAVDGNTLYIDSVNNRLGVGSTTPYSTLSVSGTAGTNPFTIASSTGQAMFTVLPTGDLALSAKITKYNNIATEGMGVPVIVDMVTVLGGSASIATTSFSNTTNNGMYRIGVYLITTPSDPTATAVANLVIAWNDGEAVRMETMQINLSIEDSIATTAQGLNLIAQYDAPNPITYTLTIVGNSEEAAYDLYLVCERLN